MLKPLFAEVAISDGENVLMLKRDYPHALEALWKALDRLEDLIQN